MKRPGLIATKKRLGACLALSLLVGACDNAAPSSEPLLLPPEFESPSAEAQVPFASHHHEYTSGSILPSLDTDTLDQSVRDFYELWKASNLVQDCGDGRYAVQSRGETVSEGIGYGMLIAAYLAGSDPDAKQIFDGLLYYYNDYRSRGLMAWKQVDCGIRVEDGSSSATDGDLDVAYALLLADRQWGSCHGIDYYAYAKSVLHALANSTVAASRRHFLLGNWANTGSYSSAARSSDMMQGHLSSFIELTDDRIWRDVLEGHYEIMDQVQESVSDSGLLPDFLLVTGDEVLPAGDDFLESPFDGAHNWNACRNPWRFSMDYLISGEKRSFDVVERMNDFIVEATAADPAAIVPGYELDGSPIAGRDYQSMAYTAPFGVAAMVDERHQAWLDAIWQTVVEREPEGYYGDSLRLLSMLVMSGNWWAPEQFPPACDDQDD